MTECLFRANVNGKFETFTCTQVKELHLQWKQTFRKQNGTDRIIATGGKDEAYNHFCESIERFLNQCKHDPIELQCPTCEASEHEGYFCRCESRNIALAKHLRQKQKDNRAELEKDRERLNEKTEEEGYDRGYYAPWQLNLL